MKKSSHSLGLPVKNAGLVLINNYIPMLFERLGLVEDQKFNSSKAQSDAVYYLQYMVTGLSGSEDHLLPLNKILCGLSISHPAEQNIEISEEQKRLMDGLIKAMIGHWPVLGECSVDAFRGNWLIRDGLLIEYNNKWELKVEKHAYDLLLSKAPFSFSILKYPWMPKPLYVNWPY